jgi:DNA repair protein RecO
VAHETVWALVLRAEDHGEVDRRVALLTPAGRVWAKVRGARRITSRMAGALDPLNVVRVTLYGRGPVYTVTGAVAEASFRRLKARLDALAAAQLLAELLDRTTPEAAGGELLPWAIGVLRRLDEGEEATAVLLAALLELLARLGWSPGGRTCPVCGAPLTGPARLRPGQDALVHPACGSGGLLLSAAAVDWMAGRGPLPEPRQEVWEALARTFEGHLEGKLRAEAFARSVLLG